MKNLVLLCVLIYSVSSFSSTVPKNCTVESWCLLKATDCFVGHYTKKPSTYLIGNSQYSVVRKVTALCRIRVGYGDIRLQRMNFTTPVEPVRFKGEAFAEKEDAHDSALQLCEIYRNDWVSAAPVCH